MIQKEVRDPLTDEILFGALEHGGTVTIGAPDNHLTFTFEQRQASAPVAAPSKTPFKTLIELSGGDVRLAGGKRRTARG